MRNFDTSRILKGGCMPIRIVESVEERGQKDARRHRDKQREAIKKHLPEIISEESIITGNRGKKIKIVIRSLDIPHFRRKTKDDQNSIGIGQGKGAPGDVIGSRKVPGQGKGPKAGKEAGNEYIETEVDLEELIELMFEDAGLPKLDPKNVREIMVKLGFKISGRSKAGPWPLIASGPTAKEGYKRFWNFLAALENETKLDELTCFSALKQANGLIKDALDLLKDPNFKPQFDKVDPFPIIQHEDLRFLKIKDKERPESRAVVIAMMDVSGSMDEEKKYLARLMLFWLVEFLRKIYLRVEIRFIVHHAEASLVDEYTFFHTQESGGTISATAYKIAGDLVDQEYSTSSWNTYLFHFSDGEDADPQEAVTEIEKCFRKLINMFGYGQINPEGQEMFSLKNTLMQTFARAFSVENVERGGLRMFVGRGSVPFLGVQITKKKHILPALEQFLRKERWSNE